MLLAEERACSLDTRPVPVPVRLLLPLPLRWLTLGECILVFNPLAYKLPGADSAALRAAVTILWVLVALVLYASARDRAPSSAC